MTESRSEGVVEPAISKVKSMRYRPVARQFFIGFVVSVLLLGWCGASNPDDPIIPMGSDKLVVSYTDANGNEATQTYEEYEAAASFRDQKVSEGTDASIAVQKAPAFRFVHLAQILTAYYFAYFIIILPLLGLREKPKDEPASIHKAVLGEDRAAPVPAE